MPQESLGFVKLEWTCPKCNSRNPGPEKTCLSCGAPQPQDVQFEQAERQELIQDDRELAQAKAGPDIHCAFCGARNPSGAVVCSQCGADLKEGVKRESGRVVGAYQTGPVRQVACPSCGTNNPETALKCAQCGASLKRPEAEQPAFAAPAKPGLDKRLIWIGVGALVVLCICAVIGFSLLSAPRESQTATVENVNWQTSIAIEQLQPATYQDWRDEIPAEAEVGSCVDKVHHLQDEPAPNANKVCGTPYTVDKGSGFAEVVQDCQYEVLLPYCEYTILEWQEVDRATLRGADASPEWPEPQVEADQRLGERGEEYVIRFETDKGQYSYPVSSLQDFQRFVVGSEWILKINALGQIVSVEPAN